MSSADRDSDDPRLRVLILSADVGEGHLAAARALHEGLADRADVEVSSEDGLWALGHFARGVIRDGYRAQLRWAPWAYNAVYGLWRGVRPARWLGGRALYRMGRRRLRGLIGARRPDIVVSTHPALTVALGRMRRRGELDAVLCATITDLTDNPMWCHRGTDLHVVMHPIAVPWVERHAGRGSVVAVRPLVSARFHAPRDVRRARAALGLPHDGGLVVVSGGGWGVGALADGVDASLQAGAGHVVALAGRNDHVRAELEDRYRGESRVRVLGFTARMPELLHAATVLVHGTGGVTSLEAVACGCPVIAFGTRLAHVQEHNRAMERLGLCTIVEDPHDLTRLLAERLAGAAPPHGSTANRLPTAEAVVATARRRVNPIPGPIMRARRISMAAACSGGLLWTVATDEAFSYAAGPLHLRPATQLAVSGRAVGLVVSAPPSQIAGLSGQLARAGVHASFGVTGPLPAATVATLRRAGDDAVPVLPGSGTVRWLGTLDALHDVLGRDGGHMFLVSRGGMSLGQYLLARSAGDHPLAPRSALAIGRHRAPRPGEILLASVEGPGARAAVLRVASRLGADGLAVRTLAQLVASSSSIRAATASERLSSAAAAVTTSATAAAPIGTPSAPRASGPEVMSGLSSTGTSTWTTNTEGATRVAGERCSAVISASSPAPEAAPVATIHPSATVQCPTCTASTTSWVVNPLQAKHSPATIGAKRAAPGRRWTYRHSAATTAPRPASTSPTAMGERCESDGVGATTASATMPPTIAATPAKSRRRTVSPSRRAPSTSSATRPTASAGCTTDSGASSSAAACTGQPSTPSAVPISHSGRRASLAMRPGRHAWAGDVSRASSAWSATPRL